MDNVFNQAPFQCRMDWGIRGVEEASARGDIIIIVDVLSFSSTVTTAVHHGVTIYPFPISKDVQKYGELVDAEVLLKREQATSFGAPSLSAPSFNNELLRGKKYILCSANGAACAKVSTKVPALLVGCFLNASSVAYVANLLQKKTRANITVIACGERWSTPTIMEHKELRPSIEDFLGAGCILANLKGTKSPEARVCITSFQSSKSILEELIWDCSSGRELRKRNYEEDVSYSLQMDLFDDVPILIQDNIKQPYFKNYQITSSVPNTKKMRNLFSNNVN